MINICIQINFKDDTYACFDVKCSDLDTAMFDIMKALSADTKFIFFIDIRNKVRFYRVDDIASVEIEHEKK